MPKVTCIKCGKIWYGWSLKYKKCYCDCGTELDIVLEDEVRIIRKLPKEDK